MKISEYNSRAREAFGKSLVDVGVSVFKAIILLFTVAPVTLILKSGFSNEGLDISPITTFEKMTPSTFGTLAVFLIAAFLVGHSLRSAGLKHIHQSKILEKEEENL